MRERCEFDVSGLDDLTACGHRDDVSRCARRRDQIPGRSRRERHRDRRGRSRCDERHAGRRNCTPLKKAICGHHHAHGQWSHRGTRSGSSLRFQIQGRVRAGQGENPADARVDKNQRRSRNSADVYGILNRTAIRGPWCAIRVRDPISEFRIPDRGSRLCYCGFVSSPRPLNQFINRLGHA